MIEKLALHEADEWLLHSGWYHAFMKAHLRISVKDFLKTHRRHMARYGRPGANQITFPEGSMAVTLSLKFNDSAPPQVDHFDYHAPTGLHTGKKSPRHGAGFKPIQEN